MPSRFTLKTVAAALLAAAVFRGPVLAEDLASLPFIIALSRLLPSLDEYGQTSRPTVPELGHRTGSATMSRMWQAGVQAPPAPVPS
jgi:hypothetical protein